MNYVGLSLVDIFLQNLLLWEVLAVDLNILGLFQVDLVLVFFVTVVEFHAVDNIVCRPTG